MTFKIFPLDVSDLPDYPQPCPFCTGKLECQDFLIPGFKPLGNYRCIDCGENFFGDLPSDYGIFDPILYSIGKEKLFGGEKIPFWKKWTDLLHSSGQVRSPSVRFQKYREIKKPALLNCLDKPYGHMLLKLFQSEYYLENFPEHDLILIIPASLAWLAPEDIAGILSVDWENDCQNYWCDTLAKEIQTMRASYPSLYFCPTLPNPDSCKIDITRFTGTPPFDRDAWSHSGDNPTIVYIWRDDRIWSPNNNGQLEEQTLLVNSLASSLLQFFPGMRFAVTGFAASIKPLSDHVDDLRYATLTDDMERSLCSLYASAHVAVGVHGSNMILPSALAGATVELVPPGRWHNAWTASFSRNGHDNVATMLYNRFVPTSISPEELAQLIRATVMVCPWGKILGMRPHADIKFANPDELRDAASKLPTLAKLKQK